MIVADNFDRRVSKSMRGDASKLTWCDVSIYTLLIAHRRSRGGTQHMSKRPRSWAWKTLMVFLDERFYHCPANICYLAALMYFYGRRPSTTVVLSLLPKTILIRLQKKRTYSLCLQPMTLILFYSLLWHTAEWCTIAFSYTHILCLLFGILECWWLYPNGNKRYSWAVFPVRSNIWKFTFVVDQCLILKGIDVISIDWLSLVYISRATSHKFTPWPSSPPIFLI